MIQHILEGIQPFPGVGVVRVQLLIPIIIEPFTLRVQPYSKYPITQLNIYLFVRLPLLFSRLVKQLSDQPRFTYNATD